jgi:thymidylate kinase
MLKSAVEASQQVRERYYYYLACNYNLSEQIRADQSNMITVVDRYVYSTYAYHVVHDPSLQWEGFSSGLIEPAIAFHVTCRPEIQISRLKRRDGDIADEEALLCTWRSLGEAFATLPLVQIDNGASTVREAVSEVMHRLEPRMG